MQIDVRRSATLTALVQVMATIPRELAKQTRAQTKAVIVPEWRKLLAEKAPGERIFHDRLVTPSTVYVSDRGAKLIAGKNGRFPRETDFGAYREDYATYTTRRGSVTRRTQRQFWHYVKDGRVFYPAVREFIPRAWALYAQTAYRTVAEAMEGAIDRGGK
ncbi:hypothetical protein [Microbacterium soli]|uniref:HK97 gp10 family phage protein n=1 Tax=Microbacterium soli TaxID=446075 RepID=A0ABP7NK72_9MICO